MKKHSNLLIAVLLLARISYGQGSQVNGTSQVHPGGHVGVYNTMTFNTGYLFTPRNIPGDNVYFTAGSSAVGASDASHVEGYAEKVGTTAFTFPIGDILTYRPAAISGAASSTNFQAAYFKTSANSATLPTNAPFPTNQLATSVVLVSTVEYWDINGSASTNLTLTWDAASNVGNLTNSLSNLVVVGFNANTRMWESLGNAGGTTGTLAGTGSVTANGVTPNNYLAFTFGSAAQACQANAGTLVRL